MRNLLQLLGTFVVFRLGAKIFFFSFKKGCLVEEYPSSLGVNFPLLNAFVLVPSRTLRSLPEDVLLFVHEALFFSLWCLAIISDNLSSSSYVPCFSVAFPVTAPLGLIPDSFWCAVAPLSDRA